MTRDSAGGLWKIIESRELYAAPPYLSVRVETVELPDGRRIDDFYQIDLRDFACIFAETEDGRIILLRQYKHGPRQVSLTFPGGHLGSGENPLDAARRELMEETGFEAAEWIDLGTFVTNSNQRCNTAHFFRATGCRAVAPPDSGDLEDMEMVLLTQDELFAAIGRGEIAVVDQLALATLATHPAVARASGT